MAVQRYVGLPPPGVASTNVRGNVWESKSLRPSVRLKVTRDASNYAPISLRGDTVALSRSDRARFIAHISRHLGMEEWGLIDAILVQFGLPIDDSWEGSDRPTYIAKMIREGDDAALSELGTHLGADPAAGASDAPMVASPGAGEFEIFISHLSEHQKFAGQLQDAFGAHGVKCFVAHKDIEPTKAWQDEIEGALQRCDALIALLHPGFHASKWTDQEIGFAVGRRKPAFAIKFGEVPYGFIGRFQAFESREKSAWMLAVEVLEKLLAHEGATPLLSRIVANAFCKSGSYSESSRLIDLVESVRHWDDKMVRALRAALKNNSQISTEGFNRVPDRTRALIKKWSREAT